LKILRLPGDKSIGHRALIFSALAEGRSRIRGFGSRLGADLQHSISALQALGVEIFREKEGLLVQGRGLRGLCAPREPIDCGNSGTTLRLLSGALVGQSFESVLDGDASLRARPMRRLARCLAPLGARLSPTASGGAPLRVQGRSLRGTLMSTGLASGQVKSAALLAGLLAEGVSEISELGPSRDHSERMLREMGVKLSSLGLSHRLEPPDRLPAMDWRLPGDPSSAAFWWTAAALSGRPLCTEEISLNPSRLGFLDILKEMGVSLCVEETGWASGEPVGRVEILGAELRGAEIAGTLSLRGLDELPLVALLGAFAQGETRVTGAAELRFKESDRIEAMAQNLSALGAQIQACPDGWIIQGGAPMRAAPLKSFGDHRIALALASLPLDPLEIQGAEIAAVSYPDFLESLDEWRSEFR